jgi:hypothetical protein
MRGVNWDAFAVFLQQRLACCNRFWYPVSCRFAGLLIRVSAA